MTRQSYTTRDRDTVRLDLRRVDYLTVSLGLPLLPLFTSPLKSLDPRAGQFLKRLGTSNKVG